MSKNTGLKLYFSLKCHFVHNGKRIHNVGFSIRNLNRLYTMSLEFFFTTNQLARFVYILIGQFEVKWYPFRKKFFQHTFYGKYTHVMDRIYVTSCAWQARKTYNLLRARFQDPESASSTFKVCKIVVTCRAVYVHWNITP